MDRELLLLTLNLVVELVAEGEVLAVLRVANLVGLDDIAGQDLEELGADLGGVDVDVLDLLFDDLLFVREVLVDVAVSLDVGLGLEQVQCLLHVLSERRKVEAEAVVDQHSEVAGSRLEAFDVLDEEQCLEQADGELVVEVPLCFEDLLLSCCLQRGTDAGEHVVESGESTQISITDVFCDLLKDTQHRALTDGAVTTFERVVVRDAFDRRLEERELITDERIGPYEMGLVCVVPVSLRSDDEIEDRPEVR